MYIFVWKVNQQSILPENDRKKMQGWLILPFNDYYIIVDYNHVMDNTDHVD